MKLEGTVIELTRGSVLLDGKPYVHNLKLPSLLLLLVGSLSELPFPSPNLTPLPGSWKAQALPEVSTKIRGPDSELSATSVDYPSIYFVQMSYIPDAVSLLQLCMYVYS